MAKFMLMGSYVTFVEVEVEAPSAEELEDLCEDSEFLKDLDWEHVASEDVEFDNFQEIK
jgi:hypothetical protein